MVTAHGFLYQHWRGWLWGLKSTLFPQWHVIAMFLVRRSGQKKCERSLKTKASYKEYCLLLVYLHLRTTRILQYLVNSLTFLPVFSVAYWSWHFLALCSLFLVMSSCLWLFVVFFFKVTKWDYKCRCVSVPISFFLKSLNSRFLFKSFKLVIFLLSSKELLFFTFLYT